MKHTIRCKLAAFLAVAALFPLASCMFPAGPRSSPAESGSEEPLPTADELEDWFPDGPAMPFPAGDSVPVSTLSESLREKYESTEEREFLPPMYDLAPDQTFYIDLGFEADNSTEEAYWGLADIMAVYEDAELTHQLYTDWDVVTHDFDETVPEGRSRLRLSPSGPSGRVWGSYYDILTHELVNIAGEGKYYLHEQETQTWGFLKQYYLALFVDPETGEKLEKPKVSLFTLSTQLEAPQSQFEVTPEGYGAFRWNPVPGADYYLVARIEQSPDKLTVVNPIARVDGTEWVHPAQEYQMNSAFRLPGLSEDSQQSADRIGYESLKHDLPYDNFTVIAVNGETHSPAGNIHNGQALARRLAYSMAYEQNTIDSQGGSRKFHKNIGTIPSQDAISLASGETVYRRRVYNYDAAVLEDTKYMAFDEGANGAVTNQRLKSLYNLTIPYSIEGTVFGDEIVIEDVDPDECFAILQEIRKLQEDAAPRGGTSQITFSESGDGPDAAGTPDALPDSGADVFATSALSEYLAINMLAGNELVDLSAFPESSNSEYLADAWQEAVYQNPLILSAEGAGTVPGKPYLVISYKEPAAEMQRKQAEIRAKVAAVTGKIITEGMTDLEKEFAINQYLCDTAEYDYAALENAAQNDFREVDDAYGDAFTPYGILINNVGVCSSYAASFNLLAEAAGLESIVVTGYMEGTLPHAWNRVKIDGQWQTVDVTNNDNEYLFNALLNLPDDAAGKVLVEDTAFLMDRVLGDYFSDDNSNEYYNVTERRFDKQAIAARLADNLRAGGGTTLRTDYDLSDDEFGEITQAVMAQLEVENLYGFHWMGVITLSTAGPSKAGPARTETASG